MSSCECDDCSLVADDWEVLDEDQRPLRTNRGVAITGFEKKSLGISCDRYNATVQRRDLVSTQKFDDNKEWLRQFFIERVGDDASVPLPPEYNFLGKQAYLSMLYAVPFIKVDHYLVVSFPYNKGDTCIKVEVLSRPFWEYPLAHINLAIQQFCEWFTGQVGIPVHISMGDLCCDVQGADDLMQWCNKTAAHHAVSRARDRFGNTPEADDYVTPAVKALATGFNMGSRGRVFFRFYDKFAELLAHKKPAYYIDKWRASGYESGPIQRAEFSLSRKFFNSWRVEETGEKIDTIQDFESQIPVLWKYLTTQWLRLVDTTTHTRKSNCEALPIWKLIQESFGNLADFCTGRRVHKTPEAHVIPLLKQAFGCLRKVYAKLDGGWCLDPAYYHARTSELIELVERWDKKPFYQGVKDAFLELQAVGAA